MINTKIDNKNNNLLKVDILYELKQNPYIIQANKYIKKINIIKGTCTISNNNQKQILSELESIIIDTKEDIKIQDYSSDLKLSVEYYENQNV